MLVILQFFSKVNIQQACVCVQVCTGVSVLSSRLPHLIPQHPIICCVDRVYVRMNACRRSSLPSLCVYILLNFVW